VRDPVTETFVTLLERYLPDRLTTILVPKLLALLVILANKDGSKHAERTALLAFSIRIGSAALAFISQIILARSMGEFEYGIFVFVWVFVILAGNLSCLGFHTVVIRVSPQYINSNDNGLVRGLTTTSRIVALGIATLIAIAGVIAIYAFEDIIPFYYLIPIILGCCALPMIALGDVLDGTARANNWPIVAMSPTFIIRPSLIIIFVLGVLLFGGQPDAKIALLAALAAAYITTLGQFIMILRKMRTRFSNVDPQNDVKNIRQWDVKKWFALSLPIFIIEGFYYLLTNADVIIVGFFLEPNRVAIYFAAAKTMALVHFIYFAVKAGAAPKFSQLVAEDRMDDLDSFAKQTARWTLIPTILLGGLVLLLGQFLLSMFGSAFVDGYPVMMILFIGILAKSLIGPGEVLLTMAGKQKICVMVYAIALTANLALNITLIPIYGITGAAFATSGSVILEAILLFFTIKSHLGIHMFALAASQKLPTQSASLSPNGEPNHDK
jgi:O-antigen/teichoic acid export membrane protein